MKMRRLQNWFYYYKWYVFAGIAFCTVLLHWAGNYFGILEKKPDLQIACLTRRPLSDEAVRALEEAFTAYAGDYNGDGAVTVRVHAYLAAEDSSLTEAQQSASASEIALVGDINDCESYLFLMEDPDAFQLDWQILAAPDGSCPAPADYAAADKVVPLSALPPARVLSAISDEEERDTLLALQAGRRCFYTEKTCRYLPQLRAFWEKLTGGQPAG